MRTPKSKKYQALRNISAFLLCVLCALCVRTSAQIVNTENARIQSDTTGWNGTFGSTFTLIKNVQQVLQLDLNAHLQYATQKDLYILLASYNLFRGSGEVLNNNAFFHLRYNREVTDRLRWEVFTQGQKNIITNIALRLLAGTGPRLRWIDTERWKLYTGSLAMLEYEKENDPVVIRRDLRSSTYATLTYQPSESFSLTGTAYYQPLFRYIGDYRLLNQLTLNFKATERLSFSTHWNYLYDSTPAAGIPNMNYSLSNGFSYSF